MIKIVTKDGDLSSQEALDLVHEHNLAVNVVRSEDVVLKNYPEPPFLVDCSGGCETILDIKELANCLD